MNRKSGYDEAAQLLRVVTGVVVVAALYIGRTVFIPLALALLLSLLLAPAMEFLGRIRVPRLLAILLLVVALCGLAGGLAWKASSELAELANQLPIYKETLEAKIKVVSGLRSSNFGKVSTAVSDLEKELAPRATEPDRSRKVPTLGSSSVRPLEVEVVPPADTLASFETFIGPMGALGMVAVFTIFILIGREEPAQSFYQFSERRTIDTLSFDPQMRRSDISIE